MRRMSMLFGKFHSMCYQSQLLALLLYNIINII